MLARSLPCVFVLAATQFGAQPPPSLRSLQPSAVTAGGPAFTLQVNGQGFTPSTGISWNGTPLATRFDTETKLTAEIAASRISTPGPALISVGRDQQTSDALTLTVNPPLDWITAATLPAAPLQKFYSQALALSGGTPPLRFALTSGAIPPGLHLDGFNGAVVGYATVPGKYELSVRATDSAGASAAQALRLAVTGELKIVSGPALPRAIVGQPYSTQLAADGGTMPVVEWKLAAGSAPRGLTLDEKTGRLAGIATLAGLAEFTLRIRDSAGKIATRAVAIDARAPLSILAPGSLADFADGDAVSVNWAAAGGTAPYTWALEDGALPPGLALDSQTGAVTGTLDRAGSYRAALRVRDADGAEATATIAIPVAVRLTAAIPAPPEANIGSKFTLPLAALGGSPPYTWSIAGGTLPNGLRLEAGGLVVGAPLVEGEFDVIVEARDRVQRTARAAVHLSVTPPPLPELLLAPLPRLEPGQQTKLDLRLDRAYPADLDVVVELGFDGPTDPAVLLLTGSRQARLAIRAGQLTPAAPLLLQTGSTAGLISIDARLERGRLASSSSTQRTAIDPTPPQIRTMILRKTTDGFDIVVTLLSPTREVENALFAFEDAIQIAVPLRQLAGAWYADERSTPFGTLFTYRQSFTVRGDISRLRGVSMTVSNSVGASVPASVAF